jgi:ribonuclease HII
MLKPFYKPNCIEAGCDEAGRGCMAGPVVAAAVILPKKFKNKWLNDSKQLNSAQREELKIIIKAEAIDYAIATITAQEIDETNILKASIKAMHTAIKNLKQVPEHLIIDGNRFYAYKNITHSTIIKGDGLYASIAAASILAKTYRDELMNNYHNKYPQYGWDTNKGYGTAAHKLAMEKYGLSPLHRKTFSFKPKQLKLF